MKWISPGTLIDPAADVSISERIGVFHVVQTKRCCVIAVTDLAGLPA